MDVFTINIRIYLFIFTLNLIVMDIMKKIYDAVILSYILVPLRLRGIILIVILPTKALKENP